MKNSENSKKKSKKDDYEDDYDEDDQDEDEEDESEDYEDMSAKDLYQLWMRSSLRILNTSAGLHSISLAISVTVFSWTE